MTPMQARQMRLQHASSKDAEYPRDVLDRISHPYGSRVDLTSDGMLHMGSGR